MRNFQLLGSGIRSKRIGQQCHLVKIAISAESILRRFPTAILLICNKAGGEEKDGIGLTSIVIDHLSLITLTCEKCRAGSYIHLSHLEEEP